MLFCIDSGLGAVIHAAAFEDVGHHCIVLCDPAGAPYGNKSAIENKARILQLTQFVHNWRITFPEPVKSSLIQQDPWSAKSADLAIIACNTGTIDGHEELKNSSSYVSPQNGRFAIGISYPLVAEFVRERKAMKNDASMHIVLLGTQRTIDSEHYQKKLAEKNITNFKAIACPNLASMIDDGAPDAQLKREIRQHLAQIPNPEIITHYAGVCTHYAAVNHLIRDVFREFGAEPKIMNHPALVITAHAAYVSKVVEKESKKELGRPKQTIFLTTGDPEQMEASTRNFLKQIRSQTLKPKDVKFYHIDIPPTPFTRQIANMPRPSMTA